MNRHLNRFANLVILELSMLSLCAMVRDSFALALNPETFLWLALLCLLAAVPAFKNLKKAATYKQNGLEAMAGLDQGSAKLQMVFSLLLSVGLIIAGLI